MMKRSWFPSKDSVGDLGAIYNLNRSGGICVATSGRQKNHWNDIKHMMTDEFEVSDPDAEQDLTEFVGQLEKIDAILPTGHQTER